MKKFHKHAPHVTPALPTSTWLEKMIMAIIPILGVLGIVSLGGCAGPGFSNSSSVSELACATGHGEFKNRDGDEITWTILPIGQVMSGVSDDLQVSDPQALCGLFEGSIEEIAIITMDAFLEAVPPPGDVGEAIAAAPDHASGLRLHARNVRDIVWPAPNDGEAYTLFARLKRDDVLGTTVDMIQHFTFRGNTIVKRTGRSTMTGGESRARSDAERTTRDDRQVERDEGDDGEADEAPAADREADSDRATRRYGGGRRREDSATRDTPPARRERETEASSTEAPPPPPDRPELSPGASSESDGDARERMERRRREFQQRRAAAQGAGTDGTPVARR